MEPFNIKINHLEKEITLTISPEKDYYRIIYFGGIIGAIKKLGHDWELVPEDEIEAGDLPIYDFKQSYANDQPKLTLNLPEINQIAAAIEKETS